MNNLQNVGGYADDNPTADMPESGAIVAPPPDFLQSQPDEDEGAGQESRSSRLVGYQCQDDKTPQHSHIVQNFPQILPQDSSYYVQYTVNLKSIDERLLNSTTHCQPKYLILQCQCGRRAVASACYKNNCISCRPYSNMKKARAIMKKFVSLSWTHNNNQYFPNIVYTVFTVPMELREKCIDPKYMQHLRHEAWNILRYAYGAEFAVEATHPISEKHPDTFHPHLNFLWKPLPTVSPYIDVTALRDLWRIALGYNKQVDVETQYSNKPGKLWKWSKYISRLFPEFSVWTGPIKWFGFYPKNLEKGTGLCQECHQQIIALGYATPELTARLLEHDPKSGTSPPEIRFYDINLFIDF